MDALTIAFTKPNYIQYLNNLNARSNKSGSIYGIERKELYRDGNGKLRFCPPMPLDEFRAEAKRQLEGVLVSIKAKNKVVTRNVNITKAKKGKHEKVQLTPRGQLHNETIYGCIRRYNPQYEKVNASFNEEKIKTVAVKRYREALLERLRLCYGDPKKAFTGRNALDKNPLFTDKTHTEKVPLKVKTVTLETVYTQRQEVNKDLNLDKVVDKKVKTLLEERLQQYGGDKVKAFSNLDENPIWLNKEKGIQVNVLGVGLPDGAPIPVEGTNDYRKDRDGNVIVTRLNEQMCQEVAKNGNGIYVRVDNSNNAQRAITKEIDKMAKADVETQVYTEFNEQFQAVAWIILILLLAEMLILERKNPLFRNFHLFSNKNANK